MAPGMCLSPPSKVVFDSQELACLHEAGHAEAALSAGAQVVEMELYRESPRSWGRTRTHRTEEQRQPIALGGFAVEYRLFRAGRLVKQSGEAPTEAEFISYSMDNAIDDRVAFFGKDSAGPDGLWPSDLDRKFMSYAIGYAERSMRFELVERIAHALLAAGKLDEASISSIIAG